MDNHLSINMERPIAQHVANTQVCYSIDMNSMHLQNSFRRMYNAMQLAGYVLYDMCVSDILLAGLRETTEEKNIHSNATVYFPRNLAILSPSLFLSILFTRFSPRQNICECENLNVYN